MPPKRIRVQNEENMVLPDVIDTQIGRSIVLPIHLSSLNLKPNSTLQQYESSILPSQLFAYMKLKSFLDPTVKSTLLLFLTGPHQCGKDFLVRTFRKNRAFHHSYLILDELNTLNEIELYLKEATAVPTKAKQTQALLQRIQQSIDGQRSNHFFTIASTKTHTLVIWLKDIDKNFWKQHFDLSLLVNTLGKPGSTHVSHKVLFTTTSAPKELMSVDTWQKMQQGKYGQVVEINPFQSTDLVQLKWEINASRIVHKTYIQAKLDHEYHGRLQGTSTTTTQLYPFSSILKCAGVSQLASQLIHNPNFDGPLTHSFLWAAWSEMIPVTELGFMGGTSDLFLLIHYVLSQWHRSLVARGSLNSFSHDLTPLSNLIHYISKHNCLLWSLYTEIERTKIAQARSAQLAEYGIWKHACGTNRFWSSVIHGVREASKLQGRSSTLISSKEQEEVDVNLKDWMAFPGTIEHQLNEKLEPFQHALYLQTFGRSVSDQIQWLECTAISHTATQNKTYKIILDIDPALVKKLIDV